MFHKTDPHFSVLKIPVDALRLVEQVEHLPERELEVHLPEVEYPPEILKVSLLLLVRRGQPHLVSLGGGGHAAGPVGGRGREGRLDPGRPEGRRHSLGLSD